MTKEPGTVASLVVGGASVVALNGPLTDLLIELGASVRLATSIVSILMYLSSVSAALWARRRTLTTQTAAAVAATALALPSHADEQDLNDALVKKDLPTVDLKS